ncbi:MAG: hypothetical protein JWQ29_2909, partial [Phenylobacterium sp.]|nr:hypothetical protein [Phenylobacterium sp.]
MDERDDEPAEPAPDRRSVLRLTTGAVASAAVAGAGTRAAAAPPLSDIVTLDAVGLGQ